jgi:precorrin-4/cobalt-precorrin-4 C11-methyltransferase
VVEKASWPEERIIRGHLADIAARVAAAGIKKTAIIAVGEVFRQRELEKLSRLYDRKFSHSFREG